MPTCFKNVISTCSFVLKFNFKIFKGTNYTHVKRKEIGQESNKIYLENYTYPKAEGIKLLLKSKVENAKTFHN